MKGALNDMLKIGVIGCGGRAAGVIRAIMDFGLGTELTAITDINPEYSKAKLGEKKIDYSKTRFYADADEMLTKEELDGIIIGTNCNTHAMLAQKVMALGIPLFLEKPVATNMEDLLALKAAYEKSKSKVVVSFPLRVTELCRGVKEIIDSGRLGTIEQVQAYNNVPYGGVYYHDWYRDESITGGLWLQKATHDFDYINWLLGLKPTQICAMTSRGIFKGSKPAGLKCVDCPDKNTCSEGPFAMKFKNNDDPHGEYCCFAVDTGNEDSGSAIIRYETGMHAVYTQNFFARKKAAKRGARLLGYKGTVEFDWYTNEIKVFMHHSDTVETIKMENTGEGHSGGDWALAMSFIELMKGTGESVAPLEAGLTSVLMCLKAKESEATGSFMEISY